LVGALRVGLAVATEVVVVMVVVVVWTTTHFQTMHSG
jgi:hypothetical protein